MGILIKKRQGGGSLFLDPRYLRLGGDNPLPPMDTKGARGARGGARPISGGTKKSTSNDIDLEGRLPSDIKYYKAKQQKVLEGIAAGFKNDENFDESPAYEMFLKEKHNIESVLAPQLKSMYSMFDKSRTRFQNIGAGDAPAIQGDKAIVQKTGTERYGVVNIHELLTNAESYRLLTGSEVLRKRNDNPLFSGFTFLGQTAMEMIESGYGSKSYNEEISKQLTKVGYIKNKVGLQSTKDESILNFKNVNFNQNGILTKANLTNIKSLYSSLLSSGNTNMNSYLNSKAIEETFRRIKNKNIILDEKTDLGELIVNRATSQLALDLKSNVLIEESKETKASGTGSGVSLKGERKLFTGLVSLSRMFVDPQHVEVENLNEEKPEIGSLFQTLPAAFVQMGEELMERGYKGAKAREGDADITNLNRRTANNNDFIHSIKGGTGIMTHLDGTPIVKTTDDENESYITTPTDLNMFVMLAPTVQNKEGKWHVDFDNEFTFQIMEAIKDTYGELDNKGYTPEKLAGGGKELLEEAENIAKKHLKRILKDNIKNAPIIKATMAFDVLYETDRTNANFPYTIPIRANDKELLDSVIDSPWAWGFSDFTRRAKAFIPISDSFWTRMQASTGFHTDFIFKYSKDEWGAILKSSPKVGLLNVTNLAAQESFKRYNESKKYGGKLLAAEEIKNLLFN